MPLGCRYCATEKPFMPTVRSASLVVECTTCAKPKLTVQRPLPFKTSAAFIENVANMTLQSPRRFVYAIIMG